MSKRERRSVDQRLQRRLQLAAAHGGIEEGAAHGAANPAREPGAARPRPELGDQRREPGEAWLTVDSTAVESVGRPSSAAARTEGRTKSAISTWWAKKASR